MIKNLMKKLLGEIDLEFYQKVEKESKERRQRNEQRMQKIKEDMGEKWIMHPSHMKSKLNEPRPV